MSLEGGVNGENLPPYEAQLHALFKSCDVKGKGVLDKEGLTSLCNKLGLEQDQTQGLLTKLVSKKNGAIKHRLKISYQEFKEGFVRFWKELAFIESPSRSPVHFSTTKISSSPAPSVDKMDDSNRCLGDYGDRVLEENLINSSNHSSMNEFQLTDFYNCNGNLEQRLVTIEDILKFWKCIGIEHGDVVLQELGINCDDDQFRENIDIFELSNMLLIELEHCIESIGLSLPREETFICKAKSFAAVKTSKAEIQSIRGALETVNRDREKLMKDLTATNQRVAAFAQDVDDQNAKIEEANRKHIRELEKHYISQIRALQSELSQEKEQRASLNQEMDHKKRFFSLQLSEQESRLKEDLCQLQKENQQLEEENDELKKRLNEFELLNLELKSEIAKLGSYTTSLISVDVSGEECDDTSSMSSLIEKQPHLSIEIEQLRRKIKDLTEHNQQLKTQLENQELEFQSQVQETKLCPPEIEEDIETALDEEIGSTLNSKDLMNELQIENATDSKYQGYVSTETGLVSQVKIIELEMVQLQERLDVALSQLETFKSQQEADEEKITSLTSKCVKLQTRLWNTCHVSPGSLTSTQSLPANEAKESTAVTQPCSLPLPIDTSTGSCRNSNELERHCQNLEDELDVVKKEILKILSEKSKCAKENEQLKKVLNSENVSSLTSNESLSPTVAKRLHDRSSPDGQEAEMYNKSLNASIENKTDLDTSKLMLEKKDIEEKCKKLEESLELMGVEFEKMEDYWQSKLDEERAFYEGQIQNSDARFKDLEARLREYEELLINADDLGKSNEQDKLSTIEESVSLECQVEELEGEIETLRNELRDKELDLQRQVQRVERFWREKLEQEKSSHALEISAMKESADELKNQADNLSRAQASMKNAFGKVTVDTFGGEGCSNEHGEEVESKPVCDAWTQLPGCEGTPTSALSSVALAYQAILSDIAREKDSLQTEMLRLRETRDYNSESGLFSTMEIVQNRLRQQEERCQHLQSALRHQQKHSKKILKDMREQHESEIRNLENLMKASQDMLQQQVSKYSDQMQRLGQSESLVRQLLAENETLVAAIRNLQYEFDLSDRDNDQ